MLLLTILTYSSNRFDAADSHLSQLRPLCSGSDPEIVFEIRVLEIQKLIRQEQHMLALQKVNEYLHELRGRGTGTSRIQKH